MVKICPSPASSDSCSLLVYFFFSVESLLLDRTPTESTYPKVEGLPISQASDSRTPTSFDELGMHPIHPLRWYAVQGRDYSEAPWRFYLEQWSNLIQPPQNLARVQFLPVFPCRVSVARKDCLFLLPISLADRNLPDSHSFCLLKLTFLADTKVERL